MKITKTTAKKKRKHLKRKERFNHCLDLGTPQVALSPKNHQKNHELLSDWSNAS